ncbi:MAG: phosphoribosylamine--glycine ligase [Phycisphaerae bacterium]|nr:phosphoribosylamine--glycine ligase [Phycisphaerae bacterium]
MTGDRVNVALIGGGGREHALALAISRSPRLGTLYVSHPQNPGLASLGRPIDVPVSAREAYRLEQFCDRHGIGLVVIGPEEPLAEGLADKVRGPGRMVFGPGADGARLEADKAWAKQLMRSASIPTAEARTFTDPEAALAYARSRPEPPVIKAAGLAKGKGVVVPATAAEAAEAIERMMVKKEFGAAGREVVIEERLDGPEVSVMALVDGRSIYVLETSQDHKRLLDGDKGPNTGGMGAVCPSPRVDDALMARVEREVLVPTVDALRREGIEYRGVLYAGLMLTHGGPKVLEFNCRFGDPECQAIVSRLESDVIDLMEATCRGTLDSCEIAWRSGASCCVVVAAPGYPNEPRAGLPIAGLDRAGAVPGVTVYHAGTARDREGRVVTAGGRVLGVTGVGSSAAEARARAYEACGLIQFEGMQYRRDIGAPAAPARVRAKV